MKWIRCSTKLSYAEYNILGRDSRYVLIIVTVLWSSHAYADLAKRSLTILAGEQAAWCQRRLGQAWWTGICAGGWKPNEVCKQFTSGSITFKVSRIATYLCVLYVCFWDHYFIGGSNATSYVWNSFIHVNILEYKNVICWYSLLSIGNSWILECLMSWVSKHVTWFGSYIFYCFVMPKVAICDDAGELGGTYFWYDPSGPIVSP